MNYTQHIYLDIFDRPYFRHVYAKQSDNRTRVLHVTLTANGQPLPREEGASAYFRARKSDGTAVLAPATVGEDGSVTFALTDQALAVPGEVQADVSLVKGEEVLSTASFVIVVEAAPAGAQIESTNEFLELMEATKAARDAARSAGEAANAANEGASAANDAAERAAGAASGAAAAAGRADEAAGSATSAADKADAAAQRAEDAAGTANQSATDADDAARKALDAAARANEAASGVGLRKEVLDHIPEPSEMVENVIYLVPAAEPNPENTHEEYMLIDGQRELIGSTAVDLTGYAKKDELAKVATSGNYADLSGTEDVATKEYVGEQIDSVKTKLCGRNLLFNSSFYAGLSSWMQGFDGVCDVTTEDGYVCVYVKGGLNTRADLYQNILERIENNKGTRYTVSAMVKVVNFVAGTKPYTSFYFSGSLLNSEWSAMSYVRGDRDFSQINNKGWVYMEAVYQQMNDKSDYKNLTFALDAEDFTGDMYFRDVKLEVGEFATDWSPAPEDVEAEIDAIEIGGRNYIRNSDVLHNTASYLLNRYELSDPLIKGEEYTISIWGKLGEGKDSFGIYTDYTQKIMTYIMEDANGVYRGTFTVNRDNYSNETDLNYIRIYAMPQSVEGVESQITGIKLERGNKATDWSPAPEDTVKQAVSEAVREVEVGGRNLLKNTDGNFISYGISNVSFQPNQIIQEWDTTKAVRAIGSGGEHTEFGYFQGADPNHWDANANYIASVYIKNNSADTSIRVVVNGTLSEVIVGPGEMKRAVIRVADRNSVTSIKQIGFCTLEAGQAFDFTYWLPKIERGNVPTDLAPVPDDQAKQIRADVDYIAMMMEVEL